MKYFVFLMVLALSLCIASSAMAAYTERWEMDVDMTQAGAGSILGTALVANGGGNGTYGVDGFDYSNGIATFLDDGASSSNQGVMFADTTGTVLGTGGYTVDMRVLWLQGTNGSGSHKSMGFAGAGGAGRGLRIDQGGLGSISSGVEAYAGYDMNGWKDLRVVVQADGIWAVYAGTTGNLILQSPNKGSTPTNGIIGNYVGFFLGSFSGSSTTLCNYSLDYVRVAQGTDIYADHNPVTPEPGSFLALGSGLVGFAGFALRRRRA